MDSATIEMVGVKRDYPRWRPRETFLRADPRMSACCRVKPRADVEPAGVSRGGRQAISVASIPDIVIAYTRPVPPSIARCELTHLAREPIDVARARVQHELYEDALRESGATVVRLPELGDCPDSVFVEDTAIILDDAAVITVPGAASRRAEVQTVREALSAKRQLLAIEPPSTLDGGDVLVLGRQVLVGLTPRSTLSAMQQLRVLLAPLGYEVRGVPVHGCLHLKSAVTQADRGTLVVNPSWVDPGHLPGGFDVIPVDAREPGAGNVLWLGATTIVAQEFPRTNARLTAALDAEVVPVPASELAKAEGGVTCCSLILRS